MTFEEWWEKWWHENSIAATDREEVWKANAKAAWDAAIMETFKTERK